MTVLKIILTIIYAFVCLALTIIVLAQESKSAGLTGSVGGMAETYWGRNKGRSIEGKLQNFTKLLAIAFIVLSLVLNVL